MPLNQTKLWSHNWSKKNEQMVQEVSLVLLNLDDKVRLGRLKRVDSEAVYLEMGGEIRWLVFNFSQSCEIPHIYDLSFCIWSCPILPHITKRLQNIWLTLLLLLLLLLLLNDPLSTVINFTLVFLSS